MPNRAGLDNAGQDNAGPDNAVPCRAVPDNAVPDNAVPDSAVPSRAVPGAELSRVLNRAAAAASGLRPPANGRAQPPKRQLLIIVNPAPRALKLKRHRGGERWGISYCLVISLFCSCYSLGES